MFTRKKSAFLLIAILGCAVGVGATVLIAPRFVKAPVSTSSDPRKFRDLLALSSQQLTRCDIALMNLLCAEGLPGGDDMSIPNNLATLNTWAERVRSETQRNLHRFHENPAEVDNSEPKYRMLMIVTVLQQDFGVRYNPARIESPESPSPDAKFFADSRDGLVRGLLGSRRMGTCSSMPVLYVAVGRRLGYPLKLVSSKGHLFVRWEGGKERFNFEGAGRGGNFYPDEYYRQWPYPISEQAVKAGHYLRSMNAADELATFLTIRSAVLESAGRLPEAQLACAYAHLLVPASPEHAYHLAAAVQQEFPLPAPRPTVAQTAAPSDALRNPLDSIAEIQAVNRRNREMMERQSAPPNSYRPTIGTPTPQPLYPR